MKGLCLSLMYVKTTSSETSPDLLWGCLLDIPVSLAAVTDYIILSCLEIVSHRAGTEFVLLQINPSVCTEGVPNKYLWII